MPANDAQDQKDYQDYLDYQKHISGASAGSPSSPAQTGLESFANTATLGYLPHMQAAVGKVAGLGDYADLRDKNIARMSASAKENPKSDIAGKVAGFGANVLAGPASIEGLAAQAALANPGDTPGKISDLQPDARLKNAALAALLGKGLEKAGGAGKNIADSLMQKAVGIRKSLPGMGTELLDQGVVGTRGQMQQQIAGKIGERGGDLSSAVSSIPGDIDVTPIAKSLQQRAANYKVGGEVPPNMQGSADQYDKLAQFLNGKGSLSPKDLLKFKSQQGDAAYLMSGNPAQSDAAQAARAAMGESGDALKQAYAAQPGIEDPNKIANLNKTLTALYKAKDGLKRGESLSGLAQYGGLGGLGALIGGAPGAAVGMSLKSPLAQSVGAKAINAGGSAASSLAPGIERLLSLFPQERDKVQ